jgi:hypothetical protein
VQPDGTWVMSGDRTESGWGGEHYSYAGSGAYSAAQGDPNSGGSWTTGWATLFESGSDHWDYGWTAQWGLAADGNWYAGAGSGWGSGNGHTDWSYSGSGSYGRPLDGGVPSGTWQESGNQHTAYSILTADILRSSSNSQTGSVGSGTRPTARRWFAPARTARCL